MWHLVFLSNQISGLSESGAFLQKIPRLPVCYAGCGAALSEHSSTSQLASCGPRGCSARPSRRGWEPWASCSPSRQVNQYQDCSKVKKNHGAGPNLLLLLPINIHAFFPLQYYIKFSFIADPCGPDPQPCSVYLFSKFLISLNLGNWFNSNKNKIVLNWQVVAFQHWSPYRTSLKNIL